MRSSRLSFAGLAAMAAIAMSGAGLSAAQVNNKTPVSSFADAEAREITKQRREQQRRAGAVEAMLRNSGGYGGARYRKAGPGWTHAQVQRMARKKKNQAKHKRACRR